MRGTTLLAILVTLTACKDKRESGHGDDNKGSAPKAVTADAGVDVDACKAAVDAAAKAPVYTRATALLACTVCGDWKPILDWNKMAPDGGPARLELDQALRRCNAPCDTSSTKKLASALDSARGTDMRAPWRILGEACKDKVSALPDPRHMSAPYFALDRIGRAIGARDDDTAKQLATLAIAIPAVTLSGVGPTLADGITTLHPAGPDVLTVVGKDIRLGTLPLAKLSATGVTVEGSYPGEVTSELDKAVHALGNAPIAIIAPAQTPAVGIVGVVGKANRREAGLDPRKPASAPIELAVASGSAPPGWQVPAAIPVALNGLTMAASIRRIVMTAGTPADDAKPDDKRAIRIELDDKTTVADLAKELATLSQQGIAVVEIAAAHK